MPAEPTPGPSLVASVHRWWKNRSESDGFFRTLKRFISTLWEFARESTPSRRRQRYGDVDYDWDYRVDTTSATVGWRDRLLGLFHSPYQPTDPALFREMLAQLMPADTMLASAKFNFREFTFIDIGSGKGRVLLMAAEYPFRRIVGIELLPDLHRIAQENIAKYRSDSRQCFAIESLCADARDFVFPPEPLVLYLFNPLPEAGLEELLGNLETSLRNQPRPVYVLYHNPLLERTVVARSGFRKMMSTQQYALYHGDGGAGLARPRSS